MDTGDIIAIAVALCGPIIAFLMGWRRAPHEEKNLDAQTVEIYTKVSNMAATQNVALLKRMEAQELRLENESEQNRLLLIGVAKLLAQMARQGIEPIWTPEVIVKSKRMMRVINGEGVQK